MMEVDDPAGEHENGTVPQIRDIHIFAVRTTARVRRAEGCLVLRSCTACEAGPQEGQFTAYLSICMRFFSVLLITELT
jgi:hypothetical protein